MTHDYRALVETARVWVLESGGRLRGVLVNVVHPDHLLLDTVAVAPDTQGSGYGAILLARAEDDARELGLPEVRLYTHRTMTENQTFYPRHGYTETGRGRSRGGFDRVYYVKRLDGTANAK
jgi:N-acetylglutamate synthase-like GNAT family acetyltransferase